MSKRWYVVHAYSGYEKKVMHALGERIRLSGMDDYFDEILVPTEEVMEMRGGQKRKSERKFFPGYVLVHMELNDATWHLVKDTPRVMGFIGGTAEKPLGTVWVGFAGPNGSEAQQFLFPFARPQHREMTVQVALDWLRRSLLGEERIVMRFSSLQQGGKA